MALLNLANVDVVYKNWEMFPLEDITVRVMRWAIPVTLRLTSIAVRSLDGTAVSEETEKLLDAKFRHSTW